MGLIKGCFHESNELAASCQHCHGYPHQENYSDILSSGHRISSFNPALLDREADPVTISCGCIRVGDASTGSRIVRGIGNGSMR